ncbi:ABC transporter ATP-binding protein [Bacillus sp. 31A1R]|uniref:ABC transporter ATP-binding protein n=1 Tax=Robertmurraya mangrovi TaxID=3098077 RepID=A0ABU5IX18_9BACI|nr:ABC transporter ATP-binding protein [Bacillus sp. 31A1R]MDZ5471709.1 ABC transporter ATP-binding protein [Bacillus sp. 31A1R]
MRKLFSYVNTYKKAMWLALTLTGLELIVELFQPMIMAIIIDEGIIKGDLGTVYLWGGLLLGLSLIAFIAGIVNTFYASDVSQGVAHDMRRDLFRKIQQFTFKNFQSFPTSSLITRLTNDVTQIQNFLFMSLRIALRAPLFIFGSMIMAFFVNVKLALILLVVVPILLIIILWILKKGILLFQRVQKKLDTVNGVIRENLIGMRLIKAYTRGSHEEKRFFNFNKTLMADNKKALRMMELTMPILLFGMNLSMVFILWYGSVELNLGGAQAGEIVAILNYATKIMFAFTVFSFLMMNYSRAQASSTRIVEVLEENIDEQQETKIETFQNVNIQGSIEFDHVSFQYPSSDLPVLHNLSFTIKAGETVGILGETGSGKSSIFQLIPQLYHVTSGEILIDGMNIEKIDVKELRKQIGLVPQEAHLFSGTIQENIGWGKDHASLDDIVQAAKEAQIHDFILSLPDQYETRVGQRGVNLSGGQKQRLSIARALVRKPSILLLDDSTSALDAHTEASILKTLKSQKCTTLIIAQKISSVKEADHILLIHEGKLVGNGNHETLMKTSPYYQDIYYSQVKEEAGQIG